MNEHDFARNGGDEPPDAVAGVDRGTRRSGRVVRIGTALGSFLVEIVNDVGPAADPLTAAVERCVIECLRVHKHVVPEMEVVDLQRGDLDYEAFEL